MTVNEGKYGCMQKLENGGPLGLIQSIKKLEYAPVSDLLAPHP